MTAGTLAILSVGAGDTKISFDPSKPDEVARACKIVKDMLRRGYVLLVEVGRDDKGPLYRRAVDFDDKTAEYIVAGEVNDVEEGSEAAGEAEAPAAKGAGKGKAKSRGHLRVAASSTNAVSVARTAGG